MANAGTPLRRKMLVSTALAAVAMTPGVAHAQLVNAGDLNSQVDQNGNTGAGVFKPVTIANPNATTANVTVNSKVVIANWTNFNVPSTTTLNVTPGVDASSVALTQATLINRVIGGNPSTIGGTINANNINFWLINQNGILFGPNAVVNANSFFASTANVIDSDLFDFYDGSIDTLSFIDSSNAVDATITGGGAGAAFNITGTPSVSLIGDGTLAFVGEGLNLQANFNSANGRVVFVTAKDVDIQFSVGSPLVFTAAAGTTIAQQTIGGTVNGQTVEFRMYTGNNFLSDMLINANVTANAAVASGNGIRLYTEKTTGGGSTDPDIAVTGSLTSNDGISFNSEGDQVNISAGVVNADADLNNTGNLAINRVGGGNIGLSATSINAAGITSSGAIDIEATGNITATSVTSSSTIDIDSTAGGNLSVGNLTAAGLITLDTAGNIAMGSLNNPAIDLRIGTGTQPVNVTLGGNVSVDEFAVSLSGAFSAQDLTTDNSNIAINATSITTGALTASNDAIDLDSTGSITTGAITASTTIDLNAVGAISTGGGNISSSSGDITLDGLTILTGAISTASANVSLTADLVAPTNATPVITTGNIAISSAGNLAVQATNGGRVFTGNLSVADDVTLTTAGQLQAGTINAANLTISEPSSVVTGLITAGSVDIDTTGALDVSATLSSAINGITLEGLTVTAGNLSATAGNISLTATGAGMTLGTVTAGNLTASEILVASGNGGTFALGNVLANNGITFNTTGAISALVVNADNDAAGGGALQGTALNLTATSVNASATTSNNGAINISTSGAVTSGNVTANNGGMTIASTGGGALTLGALDSDGVIDLDTTGSVLAGGVTASGALTVGNSGSLLLSPSSVQFTGNISAASVDVYTSGLFRAESLGGTDRNITATNGGITIDALNVLAENLTTNNGDISITARQTGLAVNATVIDLGTLDTVGTGVISIKSLGDTAMGNAGGGRILTGDIDACVNPCTGNSSTPFDAQNVFLDTSGNIQTGKIFADTLAVGGMILPANFTRANGSKVNNEVLNSSGLVDLGDSDVTNSLVLTAGQIIGGNVSAGGEIDLTATGNVGLALLGTITATSFTASGSVTLTSTDNSAITVSGFISANDGIGATDEDVTFVTNGAISFGNITATGALNLGTPSALTITGNINVGSFAFTTGLNFVANDVFAADGLNIDANLIEADAIGSANGNVTLVSRGLVSPGTPAATIAPGGVKTTSIVAGGIIDVTSLNGGFLNLGNLTADGNIFLDTNGNVTLGGVNANPLDNTIGSLSISGETVADAGQITIGGNARATDIDISGTGPVTTQNLTSTVSNVIVRSNGALSTGAITSETAVLLEATGATSDISTGIISADGGIIYLSAGRNLTTASITTDAMSATANDTILLHAGGAISTGALVAGEDVLAVAGTTFGATGISVGDDITVDAIGAVNITGAVESDGTGNPNNSWRFLVPAGTLAATIDPDTGIPTIDISGASINISGVIDGRDVLNNPVADVVLTTTGALETGQINALSLTVATPSSVTFNGSVTAPTLNIATSGGIDLGGADLTSDSVTLSADFVTAGAIVANNGSVMITVSGDGATSGTGTVTTTSISATNGLIDITSQDGGALSLGALDADTGIALDTAGAIIAGITDAGGGALVIGSTAALTPTSVTFNGSVSGASIDIDTTGAFDATGQNVTATTGALDILAGTITAGAVSAATNATMQSAGAITTASIGSTNGNVSVLGTGNGVLDLGPVTALNGSIAIRSTGGGLLDLGNLDAGNGVALNTSAAVTAGEVDAGSGALQIGNLTQVNSATFAGPLSGASVNINALNAFDATGQNVTAQTGALTINAGTITAAILQGAGATTLTSGGTVTADQVNSTGSTVLVNAGTIAGGSVSANGDATLQASGPITTSSITSTSGNVSVLGTGASTLDLGAVTATGGSIGIQSTGGGLLDLGNLDAGNGVALNTSGAVTAGEVDAGSGALQIGILTPVNSATFTGPLSGASVNIDVVNAFVATGQNVTATAGTLNIDASAITAAIISATGNATLTSAGTVTANAVNSSAGSVTIDAGAIAGGSVGAAQDALLTAGGGVTTTSITATSGRIEVESTGGGSLDLGTLTAGNGIAIDTTGALEAGSAAAGSGALRAGSDASRLASATFSGPLSGASISIFANGALNATGQTLTANGGAIELVADTVSVGDTNATGDLILRTDGDATLAGIGAANIDAVVGGTLAVSGNIDASAAALIQAADVEFGGNTVVLGSELVFRPLAGLTLGLGDGAGDFELSAAEIAGISADRLVFDAVDQNIGIANVTFGTNAGANEVVIATTGEIAITGDVIGDGSGRTFRIGGDFDGTGGVLSSRVTADIDVSEVNIGDSLLDLRADDIVFGRVNLIDAVAPLTNVQIADQFVGNSTSDLYNPLFAGALSPKLTAQPVYLRAGNLNVTYSNSALFQNSSVAAGQFSGVLLGEVGADGVLMVNPIDNTNSFAYFGQINLLIGQTVALAGGAVIVINNDTDIAASRVNGCIISSGADCRTTIVGTTIIKVPREATSILIADDGLLIPFDPLVGTNNEGLFADAAADPQPECIPGEGKECPTN